MDTIPETDENCPPGFETYDSESRFARIIEFDLRPRSRRRESSSKKPKKGRPRKPKAPPVEITTTKISYEPLHLAYCKRATITRDKLDELISQGYEIKRGEWSKKENKRLMKNWHRLCRCHPEFSDPFEVFGVCPRPKRHCKQEKVEVTIQEAEIDIEDDTKKYKKEKKSFIKLMNEYKVLQRLAYKLPNRLICDINQHCKRMIAYSEFQNTSLKALPEDIKEAIKNENESNTYLSEKYDISPAVVKDIKRKEKAALRYFKWKETDDLMLSSCIERAIDNESPSRVATRDIPWDKVQREMVSAGYGFTKSQLYQRWYNKHKRQNSHERDTETT